MGAIGNVLLVLGVVFMNAAPIELPNHGGQAEVHAVLWANASPTFHAYQFEKLQAQGEERKFRVLLTPALDTSFVAQVEVRIGGTAEGVLEIELPYDHALDLALTPGDPELQLEIAGGMVPNETRLTLVTVAIAPGYEGRTSSVTFETVPQ